MSIIHVEGLTKHFKVLNRKEGLRGAIKDLFSRDYRLVKAVENVSMTIEAGEIVGFIGPNGAGKSTTIKMLTGVLEPTAGILNVNGAIPFKDRRRYVKNIGVVLGQRTQLWWDIPVIESFKAIKEIYEIRDHVYKKNLELFDDIVGLGKLYAVPVRQLSLGQRMICDIAASFLHEPEVIFLDEPTIGLDISVKSKVRSIIRELNQLKKTTILITSHDIGDIETLCKRIILIDKGTLLYDGPIEKFNNIFGSYRTLNVEIRGMGVSEALELNSAINGRFQTSSGIKVSRQDSGWLDIVVNQEEVPLLDVLNHLMKEYPVRDIKVQEIELTDVIQKIYEGASV